ncbi:MAG: SMI1/KNR4 family protein [Lachnospiraceae bacterium]|nr:SMI1/KNR4 family protein [Lachnospiraceae bacterium]
MDDMRLWNYILKVTLYDKYGQHSATDEDIEKADNAIQQDMKRNGFKVPPIPADYAEFLKNTDGYEWNGMRFFGSKPFKMSEKYTLPSLLERNVYYHQFIEKERNLLVIGQFDDDRYVYDGDTKKYYIVDEMGFSEIDDFDSFEELLNCTLGDEYYCCIEDDEELLQEYLDETGIGETLDSLPENDGWD